ncbi:hypothetical protein Tco_0697962 [Tanacetum coccineum]
MGRVSYRHSSPGFTSDLSSSGSSLDSSLDTFSGSPSDSLLDTSSVHSSGLRHLDVEDANPLLLRYRHVSRSIALTHADLLEPRKRFRDSYSPEDIREEHIEISTADAEAVANLGISDGVGAHTKDGIGMGVKITASDIREDEEEFETAQRQLEAGRENLRVRALLCIERYQVDSLCHHMALLQEEFCQIRTDHDDARRRLRRLESFVERHLGFRP